MTHAEFSEIVNSVSQEEFSKLNEIIQDIHSSGESSFALVIAEIAASIPAIAARTTAEILTRSGAITLDD